MGTPRVIEQIDILDKSFQTSDAPDLFVVLHRSEKPESYEWGEYLNLGRLRRLSGTQRYAIPNTINLAAKMEFFDELMSGIGLITILASQPRY
ncbi:MAG TPA: hypothetical protein DCE56_30415 [Cyanobacteria bacterium UBA8553]|nr:hypothetical protein [Cyanobacteria bacterium UBA8553]